MMGFASLHPSYALRAISPKKFGTNPANASVALQMVLSLEDIECRLK
jgi:hypothetical protein